ncbi:MAG: alpha/beta hydrolase [Marinomonas sp.]
MQTLYFHGSPGSAAELSLFGAERPDGFTVPNRQGVPKVRGFEQRLDYWASLADEMAQHGALTIAGFSMGGYLALSVAARMQSSDVPVHLIAPAAPFQSGDYMDRLNGKPIFKLAQTSGVLLRAVVAMQSLACRTLPALVARQLFAASKGGDALLAKDAQFMEQAAENLRQGVGRGSAQFCEEVLSAVEDWRGLLAEVHNPVSIWHGDADNWAVPEMSDYLAANLPNLAAHNRLAGVSHYSALQHYLSQVVNSPR